MKESLFLSRFVRIKQVSKSPVIKKYSYSFSLLKLKILIINQVYEKNDTIINNRTFFEHLLLKN